MEEQYRKIDKLIPRNVRIVRLLCMRIILTTYQGFLDPTYPRWFYPTIEAYKRGEYPELPYDGPIWSKDERAAHVASLQGSKVEDASV